MSRAELGATRPRMMTAFREEYEQRLKREQGVVEVMLGQLIAMVANTGFKGFREMRQPKEFMPSQWDMKAKKPRKVSLKQRKADAAREVRKRLELMMG